MPDSDGVDADALNLLGEKRNYIGRLPKGSILTPHPKELERLVANARIRTSA